MSLGKVIRWVAIVPQSQPNNGEITQIGVDDTEGNTPLAGS